jgi:hypothetical protein
VAPSDRISGRRPRPCSFALHNHQQGSRSQCTRDRARQPIGQRQRRTAAAIL